MFFKKQGFPEDGELVLCTVTSVQYHSVFVKLDEYGRSGMIHISEVSPGRIRNIRDYVKEGKKIVCKVLRIHQEKGHIDLSLRRVNESERRKKVDRIKKEQNAEKIVEVSAKKLGLKLEELYKKIADKILANYETFSECFEDYINGNIILEELGLEENYIKILSEIINQRMSPSQVNIRGKFNISTYDPNGVEVVKNSLKKLKEIGKENMEISYLGSGSYKVSIVDSNFKDAEMKLKKGTDAVIKMVQKSGGEVEFVKD
tara:strand:- start:26464 stop:27240 length:777 start_codon:yes stop_codon:yes gene_type:complete